MKVTVWLIVFSIFLISYPVSNLFAAEKPFETSQENFFLQTSGGKQINELVLLRNNTIEPLSLQAKWVGYELISHSIDFVSLNQTSINLQPMGIDTVNLTFAVPSEIKSGDYYGSLAVFSSTDTIEIPFTLRVLGELGEKIEISSSKFSEDQVIVELKNHGNITTSVRGELKLESLLGNIQTEEIKPTTIRAGERKTLSFVAKPLIPGYYRADVALKYGSKDYLANSFFSFWVHPSFYLVGFVTLVGVLSVFLIFRGLRKNV